jgi:hypothetical protein
LVGKANKSKERKKERNEVKHCAHAKFIISGSGKTWDCNPLPFVLTFVFFIAFPKEGKFSLDDITWNGRGVS